MCYFITVAVPNQFAGQVVEMLRPDYGVSKAGNPSLRGYLPEDFSTFYVITGGCSCDLFQMPGDIQASIDNIREKYSKPKYKKRGWSDAKIERAVQDKIRALKHGADGLSPALRHRLVEIVGITSGLFILVHWYSGAMDEESISLRSEKIIHPHELINDDRAIAEDTWIELKS